MPKVKIKITCTVVEEHDVEDIEDVWDACHAYARELRSGAMGFEHVLVGAESANGDVKFEVVPYESCPQCGTEPPYVCKMSCDRKTYKKGFGK